MKQIITQEQALKILDTCYEKAVVGLPNTKTCQELANEYMFKHPDPEIAAEDFVKWQIAKCATSGFVTSFGGLFTLPVTIPANLASVWYIQLRMIATIAIMAGYNPNDDDVQTLCYICLTGTSLSKVAKEVGVQFGNKFTMAMIKKLPGSVLTKINRAVGFRFVTKFGTKGLINLGKAVPIVGGVIGGGFDYVGTKVIAKKAQDVFFKQIID